MLSFGEFQLQPEQRQLLQGGEAVVIGMRAFDVLQALAERHDRVVTKSELLDLAWPGLVVEENNLQVQISSLRKLLGRQAIATIPGRGYRFTAALETPRNAPPAAPTLSPFPSVTPAEALESTLSNLPAELPPLYGRADDLPALDALIGWH
ncbi:MAG: winged helix-turn-helix domain-containing protein, partial [Caldimonas sp.]